MPYPFLSTRRMQRWHARILIALITGWAALALCLPLPSAAQGADIGTAKNAIGMLVVRSDGVEQRLSGKGALALYEGDTVQTDASSSALIELRDGMQIGLNRNTAIKLLSRWEQEKGLTHIIRVKRGELWLKAGIGPKQLEIETPVAIYRVAFWLSIAYLLLLFVSPLLTPFTEAPLETDLQNSRLPLSLVQALATISLGAFYVRREEKS